MDVAQRFSELSSAKRLQVGAIVVKDDRIISIGYNGMPSGWDNDCEKRSYTELDNKYQYLDEDGSHYSLVTRPEVLHAESNSLAKIARSTNSSEGASLFVTHAPCLDCAKMMYQAGINSVYYRNSYRDNSGVDFLKECNIKVEQI
jgi:dCMP deaminase